MSLPHGCRASTSFFDHDLSRYHSRAGIGAEYWRDYLKIKQ
ncbi:inverse autotransporter beta domain-containing protein [Escherichia coli]|nr:inverse autotransporter beta domain-containing protein [Escherichia coli]